MFLFLGFSCEICTYCILAKQATPGKIKIALVQLSGTCSQVHAHRS